MEQLRLIRDDWETAQAIRRGIGARLARVKRLGVSWRRIAEETVIPMTAARRYAKPHLTPAGDDTVVAR